MEQSANTTTAKMESDAAAAVSIPAAVSVKQDRKTEPPDTSEPAQPAV